MLVKTLDTIILYTDGSKKEDTLHTGIGITCPFLQIFKMFKLSHHPSIFTVEATGICEALEIILEEKISPAVIASDSRSVLTVCPDLKRERYTRNANSSTCVRMFARAKFCVWSLQ